MTFIKKKLLHFTILCIAALAANGQTAPKLSHHSQRVLNTHQTDVVQRALFKKGSDEKNYIGGLIKVTDAAQAEISLKRISAWISTKAGNVWSVKFPENTLQQIPTLRGISYVQLDEPVQPQMNEVRIKTRVDSVVQGLAFPTPYTGKGVVVGVIDFGFDYNHPAFRDTTNSRIRISKVWEQGGTGTPPQGYNYGRELADSNAIKNATTDNDEQTHGTNVAGVAAGSGVGSALNGRRLRGIAFDAELVFVCVRRDSIEQQWKSGGFSDFVDAVAYIFNYANSVYKPCVINISWGSHSGPHNGTTLMNEAFNNLANAGNIIVMSAGNDGEQKLHLTKTFSPSDTLVSTFLKFSNNVYNRTWVDVWGEANKSFCMKVDLYRNDSIISSSQVGCTDNQNFSQILTDENGDSCIIDFVSSNAEYNGQPRITADIYNKTHDSVVVHLFAQDGTIHTWNEYYYYGYQKGFNGEYASFGKPWATDGDTKTTVSDMGLAQEVLLIGAYCSKVGWRNLNNETLSYGSYVSIGQIAPFSSRGPSVDGRIKPDITAPGITMASPASSYNAKYLPGGSSANMLVVKYDNPPNNRTYYYSEFTGTSASGPVASGIVALMLQANPHMFPFHVRNAIQSSALQDNFTGSSLPNDTWGAGKINAVGAVKNAILLLNVPQVKSSEINALLYPNPATSNSKVQIQLHSNSTEKYVVQLTDITGKTLHSEEVNIGNGVNEFEFSLPELTSGIYMLLLNSPTQRGVVKVVVK